MFGYVWVVCGCGLGVVTMVVSGLGCCLFVRLLAAAIGFACGLFGFGTLWLLAGWILGCFVLDLSGLLWYWLPFGLLVLGLNWWCCYFRWWWCLRCRFGGYYLYFAACDAGLVLLLAVCCFDCVSVYFTWFTCD